MRVGTAAGCLTIDEAVVYCRSVTYCDLAGCTCCIRYKYPYLLTAEHICMFRISQFTGQLEKNETICNMN